MADPRSTTADADLQFEYHELEETVDETELAVAEHLIADLLVRAWRAKQARKKVLADKRLGQETSRN